MVKRENDPILQEKIDHYVSQKPDTAMGVCQKCFGNTVCSAGWGMGKCRFCQQWRLIIIDP